MTEVTLGLFEAEEGHVPPLCLRCGAPANVYKAKQCSWYPGWVYWLLLLTICPFIIASVILRKRRRVLAPFCEVHRNYWLRCNLIFIVSLAAPVFLMLGLYWMFASTPLEDRITSPPVLFWFLGLAWLIIIPLVHSQTISAKLVTERDITLHGVATEFANRLREERERAARHLYPGPTALSGSEIGAVAKTGE